MFSHLTLTERFEVGLAIAVGVAISLAHSSPAKAAERAEVTRPATREGSIAIHQVSGSLKITGWDKDQLSITGTVDDESKLEVDGDPGDLHIRVKGNRDHGGESHADLVIKLPAKCRLDVSVVSADIDAADLAGRLEAKTVSGAITVRGKLREMSLKSVSGNVKAQGVLEQTHIKTVSGDVTLSDASGELSVKTVSGKVSIAGVSVARSELKSVSGGIEMNADLKGDGTFEMESQSGDFLLTLPATAQATFDISSFSGKIESDFAHETATKSFGPGSSTHFSTGASGAGAHVSIKTFSGNVRVRKK
jgi:DUF4097 and DUF4098 domain-containing protein YvlB